MSIASKKWIIELIWWLATFVIAALILLPIYLANIEFDWFVYNLVYLVGAITLVRYVFTLHHHPFSHSKVFKIVSILVVPLLFFPILEGLHSFLEFCDQIGLFTILDHLTFTNQKWYANYIRIEYVLAGVTCFIGVFALIVKMIRSLWRQVKFGSV